MAKRILLYDGSFDGLLTAIYEAYYQYGQDCEIYHDVDYRPQFEHEVISVYPDQQNAQRVAKAISEKLGTEVFQYILYAFYSEDALAGNSIYQFLRLAFKQGADVMGYRTHPSVEPIWRLYRKVTRESHRMVGLIRFVETASGLLVSQYETDYFVLPILASHFFNRLSHESWMLHDLRRSMAALCNGKQWKVVPLDCADDLVLSANEALFQQLWKTYFKHISIKERENKRLQMHNMPQKYWKYLIEK